MLTVRSRRRLAVTAAAATTLLLTACGSGEAEEPEGGAAGERVTIVDAQKRSVDVPVDPEVVVVTDWSVIRTLTDLGVEVDAVPAPNAALPQDLSKYAEGVKQIGTVFEPDYEAISAMEPDLVIVGSRSGTPEVVAEFAKFAPVIDMSVRAEKPEDTFAATRERVVQLGSVFGKKQEAETLMGDIEKSITEVRDQVAAAKRTAMFVQVSDGTVGAYGPGSRFGSLYHDFGYAPTAAPIDGEGQHGEEISQEFFVQYNPGVLFVLDRGKAVGQPQTPALDVLNNGLVGTTDAAKDKRIVEVDGFSWYLAASAPGSWKQMVEDVRKSL